MTNDAEKWHKENYGKMGLVGFCECCGNDWNDLPQYKAAKDATTYEDGSYHNIFYWVCSRECVEKITQDIKNGIRHQKSRSGKLF